MGVIMSLLGFSSNRSTNNTYVMSVWDASLYCHSYYPVEQILARATRIGVASTMGCHYVGHGIMPYMDGMDETAVECCN